MLEPAGADAVVTSSLNMDLDLTTEEFTTEVVEAAVEAEAG